MTCPHCGESARFLGYRPRTVATLMGPARFARAYYHCRACRAGACPSEPALGLGASELTPAAAEVVAMAGVLGSFADAADAVLRRMSGLRLSESTVRRATEAAGGDVGRRLNDGEAFGPAAPWAWHRDAEGKTCAYLAIDATGVPQQGPGGAAAEGKMATVAMVYNPVPEDPARWARPGGRRPPWQARYVCGLHGQAGLGEPLRRQSAQVGIGRAQRWIALSDGGSGLEDWIRLHFGRVEAVILDFYHASEHLAELARAWDGPGAEAAVERHRSWAHRLKHEGGEAMLGELRGLAAPPRARDAWRATVTYFENQVHRMDYPTYRAKGWQIGSGPVEAACKAVVGQRLKGAGMRWGLRGSDAVAHLRALFLGERGQWAAYWAHRQSRAA